jgi:phytoene/squalene synthetase
VAALSNHSSRLNMHLRAVCMLCCAVLQVESVEDYDLYCHYVAGLVGVGLSQLFGECVTSPCQVLGTAW